MFNNLVGQTIDRYNVTRLIDEDSLGAVYQAYDTSLQREVALRVVNPSIASQADFAANFIQLARIAARLNHPNLVQVYDSGETRALKYIVMEYIPGDNLEKMLNLLKHSGRWMLLGEAIQLVRQVAQALGYVRNQGAPQRIPDPRNIKIKPLEGDTLPYLPVITDLGLGRLASDGGGISPAYLSPEEALGRTTDTRSDVYSLGILLFELSTGQLPFPIENLDDAVRYHTRQPLPPPRSIRPDLPESLEKIIIRSLEKNPQGRYPDIEAFADDLERVVPEAEQVTTAPAALESAVSLLVPYRQSLERGPGASVFESAAPALAVTQEVLQNETPAKELEVTLENAQLSVEPGNRVSTIVSLINRGATAGNFRLTVEGIPPAWISIVPQAVQVKPGEQKEVSLVVQPTRSAQSRAGRYPFTVRVSSQQIPPRLAEVKGTLTVGAFAHFTSQLDPPRLPAGQTGQIAVNNLGNTHDTFTFNFRDMGNDLAFTPPQAPLRLAEGQSGVAEFRADLRQPRWIGGEETYPFRSAVVSTSGDTQWHDGEVISRPMIPVWVLGILLVGFLCFAGSLFLVLGQNGIRVSRATASAVSQQTGTVAAIQSTSLAGTALAEALINANQATLQSITATAAALGTKQAIIDAATALASTAVVGNSQTQAAQAATIQAINAQAATAAAALTQAANQQGAVQATQAAATAAAIAQLATANAQTATANASGAIATAQSAAATSQAATLAANMAATVSAIQTATALAGKITPIATTPVPPPGRRVVYIFLNNPSEGKDYQRLLQANGFQVDLVPQDAIPGLDFSPYQAVLIGQDTGKDDVWGDQAGSQAGLVIAKGLPVLGMGDGGYAFFGKAGLVIGFPNGVDANGTDITVIDAASPIWTTPFVVPIPENKTLNLYSSASPVIAITGPAPRSDITLVASQPNDPGHYSILRQNKYMFWGFSSGPATMTPTGQMAFVNVLRSLLP